MQNNFASKHPTSHEKKTIFKKWHLYDPEKNGLNIDMWINSDGNEIKSIFNRIEKINLSNDAREILNTTLLTNSYFPINNISEENFLSYKINYLIILPIKFY